MRRQRIPEKEGQPMLGLPEGAVAGSTDQYTIQGFPMMFSLGTKPQ